MYKDNKLLHLLERAEVELVKLSSDEEEAYRLEWFNTVIPKDKKKAAMEVNCFGKYELFDDSVEWLWGYLWHVFSFGLLKCLDGDEARKEFNNIRKQQAVLLDNINGEAYRLRNISDIILAECFDKGEDILLTDTDFRWTYAKTHESDLGPYFHYVRAL